MTSHCSDGSGVCGLATTTVSSRAARAAASGYAINGSRPSCTVGLAPPRRLPRPPARIATSAGPAIAAVWHYSLRMAAGLLPLEDAIDRVLATVAPLDVEEVRLDAALGRVLAEDVAAREPVPAFANSAMDGFAVRAADVQGASDA